MDPVAVPPQPAVSLSPPRRRLPLRRKLMFIGVLLVLLLAFSLLLLELAVRVGNRAGLTPLGPYEHAPGVPFKLTARMPGMNSHGYRDREHPDVKAPGTFRLAIIGDSYVWGTVAYEQNFPKLLEDRLNALGPDRIIEVVNLGQQGYGPGETLGLWRHEAARLQADAVIYGFYCGNDFTDPSFVETRRAVLGEYLILRKSRLLDRSLFAALVRQKGLAWRVASAQAAHPSADASDAIPAEPAADDPAMIAPWAYHLALFAPGLAERNRQQADVVRGILAEMKTFSDTQHVPLLVLSYPSQLMVDPTLQQAIAQHESLSLAGYDFGQLAAWLDRVLTELNVSHADIAPALAAQPDVARLYSGSHWNPAGNQIAAAAMIPPLRAFLEAQGLHFTAPETSPQP